MSETELQQEVARLEERVTRLEWAVMHQEQKPTPWLAKLVKPSSGRELIALLKQMGVVRDPLPEEEALAEEWRRLPEEEKQAHIEYMRSLELDPPLSQIIIESRR
jgi:hypothetical protein